MRSTSIFVLPSPQDNLKIRSYKLVYLLLYKLLYGICPKYVIMHSYPMPLSRFGQIPCLPCSLIKHAPSPNRKDCYILPIPQYLLNRNLANFSTNNCLCQITKVLNEQSSEICNNIIGFIFKSGITLQKTCSIRPEQWHKKYNLSQSHSINEIHLLAFKYLTMPNSSLKLSYSDSELLKY